MYTRRGHPAFAAINDCVPQPVHIFVAQTNRSRVGLHNQFAVNLDPVTPAAKTVLNFEVSKLSQGESNKSLEPSSAHRFSHVNLPFSQAQGLR
jgi:hypothetical protein